MTENPPQIARKIFLELGIRRRMAWVFERPKAARLLHVLPKGGSGAEIGVHLGDFSSLLRWSKPRKLFLIDPWKYASGDQYKDSWYGGTADKAQELAI
jgi:hypothetical protein